MYDVTATANAAALHYDPMVAGPVQRIWNESEFTTPDPVTSYDEATFTITAQPGENSPEGTVVAIYVGGQKVAEGVGTQTYVIPQTDADQFVSYYATATAPADAADMVKMSVGNKDMTAIRIGVLCDLNTAVRERKKGIDEKL